MTLQSQSLLPPPAPVALQSQGLLVPPAPVTLQSSRKVHRLRRSPLANILEDQPPGRPGRRAASNGLLYIKDGFINWCGADVGH